MDGWIGSDEDAVITADEAFGNYVVTEADGTRKLRNLKVGGGTDSTLISGVGMSGDGSTQYGKTGITPDIGAFTIYHSFEVPTGNAAYRVNGAWNGTGQRFYYGLANNATNLDVGFGNNVTSAIPHGISVGGAVNFAWTWDGASATSNVYVGGVLKGVVDMTAPPTSMIEFFLIALNNYGAASAFHLGLSKDFYFIAEHSTQEQVTNHFNHPEMTFFYDADGNLQSGNGYDVEKFKTDTAAGKAGWIPMGENASCGGYIQKHGLSVPANVVSLLSGWLEPRASSTITYTDDGVVVTADGTATCGASYQVDNLTIGQEYVARIKIHNPDGQVIFARVDEAPNLGGAIAINNPAGENTAVVLASKVFTATSTTHYMGYVGSGPSAGETVTIVDCQLSDITNLVHVPNFTSTMTTNSIVDKGTQSLLLKKDAFGAPIGLSDPFELEGDGRGYVDLGKTLDNTAPFEVDFIVDMSDQTIGGVCGYRSSGTAQFYFYRQANKGLELNYGLGSVFSGWNVSSNSKIIVTAKYDSGVVSIYETGVFVKDVVTDFTSVPEFYLLSRQGATTMLQSVFGSFQITNQVRTDAQRTIDVNILAARHGITL